MGQLSETINILGIRSLDLDEFENETHMMYFQDSVDIQKIMDNENLIINQKNDDLIEIIYSQKDIDNIVFITERYDNFNNNQFSDVDNGQFNNDNLFRGTQNIRSVIIVSYSGSSTLMGTEIKDDNEKKRM